MAVDSAFGLVPFKPLVGNEIRVSEAEVDASSANLFIGTPITREADGKVTAFTPSAGAPNILGVVVGVEDSSNHPGGNQLSRRYLAAADTGRVLYVAAEEATFLVQEDSDSSSLDSTAIGAHVDLTAESGNTTTGNSTVEIDSSNVGTGENVRVLGFPAFQNETDFSTSTANKVVEVKINETQAEI